MLCQLAQTYGKKLSVYCSMTCMRGALISAGERCVTDTTEWTAGVSCLTFTGMADTGWFG